MRKLSLLCLPALYYASLAIANVGSTLAIIAFGGGATHVALAYLLYDAAYAFSSWLWPLAMRGRGRRSVLAISYALLALSIASMSLAPNLETIILLQLVYGASTALIPPVQTSVFVEVLRIREHAIYTAYLSGGLGFVLGALLGAFLRSSMDLRSVIAFGAVLALTASLLSLTLPPTIGVVEAGKVVAFRGLIAQVVEKARMFFLTYVGLCMGRVSLRRIRSVFRRTLPLFLMSVVATYTSILVFFSALPPYLRKVLGVSEEMLFLLSVANSSTSTTIYAIVRRLGLGYQTLWRIHIAALTARVVLFLLPIPLKSLPTNNVVPLLVGLYVGIGATWAFIGSVQQVIMVSISEPERRDERLGQLNAAMSIGSIFGCSIASVLGYLGYETLFVTASVLMVCAVAMNIAAYRSVAR